MNVIIIVTYKVISDQFLKLNKLWNNVIVVDNTSVNLGYGGGINVGIRKALTSRVDWVVILNQDINANKNNIDALDILLQKYSPRIIGPYAGGLDRKRWTTIHPSQNIDYISGACMAIHRKVIEKVGLFYEPYFMYYEDADYCVRAKKAGFPLIHVPVKGITHDDNPSLGKGSFLHEYYLARNHLLFVERLAPLRVKSHEYIRLPKTLAEHALHKNTGALVGIKDYFLRRFGEKKL